MLFCPNQFADGTGGSVVELCPDVDSPALYFTELIVNGNLVIPDHKPPKTHMVNQTYHPILKHVEVVTVTLPDGTTPGNKILVSGIINIGIQYIADEPTQKVHFVHFEVPFNALVLDDCGLPIPVADPIFPDNFVVHVCVEKAHFTQINSRTIAKEIVLMVWVEPAP